MGLATIDPHSQNVQTKLYKIPKFGVNRPNSKTEPFENVRIYREMYAIRLVLTEIQRFKNVKINKALYGHRTSGWPYSALLILTFLNRCISVKTSLIKGLSAGTGKLCIFGNLGLVFIWRCFISFVLSLTEQT